MESTDQSSDMAIIKFAVKIYMFQRRIIATAMILTSVIIALIFLYSGSASVITLVQLAQKDFSSSLIGNELIEQRVIGSFIPKARAKLDYSYDLDLRHLDRGNQLLQIRTRIPFLAGMDIEKVKLFHQAVLKELIDFSHAQVQIVNRGNELLANSSSKFPSAEKYVFVSDADVIYSSVVDKDEVFTGKMLLLYLSIFVCSYCVSVCIVFLMNFVKDVKKEFLKEKQTQALGPLS